MFNQQEPPLVTAVRNVITNYISTLVRSGQMSQFNGANIASQLNQNVNMIVNQLATQYQREGNVPTQAIDQVIAEYTAQIVRGSQPQPTSYGAPHGFNPNTGFNPGLTMQNQGYPQGGGNMFDTRNQNLSNMNIGSPSLQDPRTLPQPALIQPHLINTTPIVAATIRKPGKLDLARYNQKVTPVRQFRYKDDPEATKYSMRLTDDPNSSIFDVRSRALITDDLGTEYHYSDVVSYIPEPSVMRAINNFKKTNPILCNNDGNWIARIAYSMFDLREVAAKPVGFIDISSLYNVDTSKLPVDNLIQKVLDSIGERNYDVASCIAENLVKAFNINLAKYVRLSTDINQQIKITEMRDIGTLASMRDRDFGGLTFHENYPTTILKCFREAIVTIVSEMTKTGFYDPKDIAEHLLSSPKFVIRENGICEREMDISNERFMKAISDKYTVIGNFDTIVVSNFIPDELEQDLDGNAIIIEGSTNPFDYLISEMWRNECPPILMVNREGGCLMVRIGRTLDGVTFIYKDNLDLE